jgi:hypothetical protein
MRLWENASCLIASIFEARVSLTAVVSTRRIEMRWGSLSGRSQRIARASSVRLILNCRAGFPSLF